MQLLQSQIRQWLNLFLGMAIGLVATMPLRAEEPDFLPLSLDYLGEYVLPHETEVQQARLAGMSGITYDAQADEFYVISDDRSDLAPARFYKLKVTFDATPKIAIVEVLGVTFLQNEARQPYAPGSLDPEGIWRSDQGRLWISSEGVASQEISPFVHEIKPEDGSILSPLPFPDYYLPKPSLQLGVKDNEAFESLTGITQPGTPKNILFVGTEYALAQEQQNGIRRSAQARILQYDVSKPQPKLLGEYVYPLDLRPLNAVNHGLVDLMAIDDQRLLSLERSFGRGKFTIKLFQTTLAGAEKFAQISTVNDKNPKPIRKRMLLNLDDLGIPLDNYEGVILGAKLPDGSQSLLIISDNNLSPNQRNSFLLFRIKGLPQRSN